MKKILALTLAIVLCLGVFVGCQPKEVWEQNTVAFAEQAGSYKAYGRVAESEKGVEIIWPASGVEFTVKCSGEVKLNYNAFSVMYMSISVDGGEPAYTRIRSGKRTLTLAENLPEGEHTFRIVNENDIDGGGSSMHMESVEFYGVKQTLKATPEKLYIEFIGDSITSGRGVLRQGGASASYEAIDDCHSPVNGYAVRTAEALNADWSLVSKGGCGYYRTDVGCKLPISQMYPYLHPFALHPVEYTATRKADIVVLGLGHNDNPNQYSEAQIKVGVEELIGMVRAMHGENTPIVLLTGMMSINRWHNLFPQIAAEQTNVYFTSVPKNNDGALGHPDVEASIETAEILSTYIRDNVLPTLQK